MIAIINMIFIMYHTFSLCVFLCVSVHTCTRAQRKCSCWCVHMYKLTLSVFLRCFPSFGGYQISHCDETYWSRLKESRHLFLFQFWGYRWVRYMILNVCGGSKSRFFCLPGNTLSPESSPQPAITVTEICILSRLTKHLMCGNRIFYMRKIDTIEFNSD